MVGIEWHFLQTEIAMDFRDYFHVKCDKEKWSLFFWGARIMVWLDPFWTHLSSGAQNRPNGFVSQDSYLYERLAWVCSLV